MTEQTEPVAGAQSEPDMPEHVAPGDSGHADHHNLLADDVVWLTSNVLQLHSALSQIANHPAILAIQERLDALEANGE